MSNLSMPVEYKEKKVLLIDNSPVITRIIRNNLIGLGFDDANILAANNGDLASMMLDMREFQLVTTGLHMEIKDGFELIREVRASDNDETKLARIVVITSERDPAIIEGLKSEDINAYLPKPFTPDQISATIHKVFNVDDGDEAETKIEPVSSAVIPESKLEVHPGVIKAFVDCTLEALGQYMVAAVPGAPVTHDAFNGYFSPSVDLSNKNHGARLLLALNFPKDAACKIYEGIFGEVDMNQVAEVVKELINIIGGIVKPKLAEFSGDILALIHPDKAAASDAVEDLSFDLGLPAAQVGEGHSFDAGNAQGPKFIVPFQVENEKFDLIVVFQKLQLAGIWNFP